MPTRTAGDPDTDQLVTKEYGQLLLATFKALSWPDKPGIKEFIAKETDISYPTAWRVFTGAGSIEAATQIRRALLKRGANPDKLPPPVIASSLMRSGDGIEVDAWADLGRRWMKADPEGFEAARAELDEWLTAQERAAKGISLIKNPLPRRKG